MRLEAPGQFHFQPHQIRGPVGILFAALIAAHSQAIVDLGRSFEGIGLAQRNLVSTENVLVIMELVVLADYDPEVFLGSLPRIPSARAHRGPPRFDVGGRNDLMMAEILLREPENPTWHLRGKVNTGY